MKCISYGLKVFQSCGLKAESVDTMNKYKDTEQMTQREEALEKERHDSYDFCQI